MFVWSTFVTYKRPMARVITRYTLRELLDKLDDLGGPGVLPWS